jgi:hypothetical protein
MKNLKLRHKGRIPRLNKEEVKGGFDKFKINARVDKKGV